ncbi:MAG: GAF domain-containing protein, partial [Chloroflexota bacterium]
MTRLPGGQFLNRLNIGWKLNIGFGILVALTLLVVILSFIGSREATNNINLTGDLRVPSALASAKAQASLLEMVANIRGYLVLSDPQLITDYNQAKQRFEENLLEMEQLALIAPDPENDRRLAELRTLFTSWSTLSEQLFELHKNSRKNQPALDVYHSEVRPLSVAILIDMGHIIQLQNQRETSIESIDLLNNMIDFQTSFESMMTDLHAYAAVSDLSFKSGYMSRLPLNTAAWENMRGRKDLLNEEQQARLESITLDRENLFDLPFEIFEINEGERAYEDLYLFRTESAPQAQQLLQILNEITIEQQILLQADLNKGRQGLVNAQIQTFSGGFLVIILGISLALIFKAIIAGPIHRLISTAEQIGAGNLSAQAKVETNDEIGQLAKTLNYMSNRLQNTIGSLEKQTEQLETLVEISQRLTSKLDVTELASSVVRRIKGGFNFYDTVIYFLDDEEKQLIAAKSNGSSAAEFEAESNKISLNREDSLVATAARSGKTISIDNVVQSDAWQPNPLFPHTRSEMAVPILIDDQVVGVLDVHQNEVAGFGEDDAKLMRSLANYVAVAL